MPYELHDGRILTWSLEAHVVDHCNLRCAQCCSLSPELPARFLDLDVLSRDLALAARVLRPAVFKLTGGEPLLHPGLPRALELARASGLAAQISVSTNGLLAPRMPDAFWERLDRLTLSVYSSAPLPEAVERLIAERCRRHDIVLNVKRFDAFQRITPDAPHDRAREVFATCWMKVRCHRIHDGRLYACTRPPHLGTRLGRDFRADGVALDAPLGAIRDYLERDEPLAACRWCLGTSGPWESHRQARAERMARAPR